MLQKMMLLKKSVYDKLVAKVKSIDTSKSVLKTKYDRNKSELETNIPDTARKTIFPRS